jgi:hypothetical protein
VRDVLEFAVFIELRLSKLLVVRGQRVGHGLEGANWKSSHLLQFVDELDPLFEFCDEVPGGGEIEHDDEGALL